MLSGIRYRVSWPLACTVATDGIAARLRLSLINDCKLQPFPLISFIRKADVDLRRHEVEDWISIHMRSSAI